MRKRLIVPPEPPSPDAGGQWLDLERLASVEVSSEHPEHPVEAALLPGGSGGWRAGAPGRQTIRIVFDTPQRLRRIRLEFVEALAERTQEFVLRWSADGRQPFTEILRQQWNFSPAGSTRQAEDYRVDLAGVKAIELHINPDIRSEDAVASLERLRLG